MGPGGSPGGPWEVPGASRGPVGTRLEDQAASDPKKVWKKSVFEKLNGPPGDPKIGKNEVKKNVEKSGPKKQTFGGPPGPVWAKNALILIWIFAFFRVFSGSRAENWKSGFHSKKTILS